MERRARTGNRLASVSAAGERTCALIVFVRAVWIDFKPTEKVHLALKAGDKVAVYTFLNQANSDWLKGAVIGRAGAGVFPASCIELTSERVSAKEMALSGSNSSSSGGPPWSKRGA